MEGKRLPRLRFVDGDSESDSAFGFLDPNDVVRGAHLIPAFGHGHTSEISPLFVPPMEDDTEWEDDNAVEGSRDWAFYYVNL